MSIENDRDRAGNGSGAGVRGDPAGVRSAPRAGPRAGREFLEGARAFHPQHGIVDVLAVVGRQRLIRVQPGRSRSEIAVLAVHEGELSPVDQLA